MNLFSDIHFPVMIIGAQRCGTTALAQYVEITYNNGAKMFQEPGGISIYGKRSTVEDIIEFGKTNNDYIIKLFAQDFFQSHLHYHRFDLSKFYLIRIRRRDMVERIFSHYVAYIRKSWYFSKNTILTSLTEPIPVDIERIKQFIRYIVAWDEYLNNIEYHLDVKLNADVFLEDIQFSLEVVDSKVSPKPSNSIEIREIIEHELALHLNKR